MEPLHSPWLWVIPSQVQVCMPPLEPIMCPGYFSMDDGPDSRMLWWGYKNCWWCHHLWESDEDHDWNLYRFMLLHVNMDLHSTKRNVKSGGFSYILWYCLWCKWSSPKPKEGRCNPWDASTREQFPTITIPRNGFMYISHHSSIMLVADALSIYSCLIGPEVMLNIVIHHQYCAQQCTYWPGINEDISKMVEACPTCQCYCQQEPGQPVQPTPVPECTWQHLSADFEYLVIIDYYTRIPFIRKISPSQCSRSFSQSIEFLKTSDLTMAHNLPAIHLQSLLRSVTLITPVSYPRNPRSNGQAEAAVKATKCLHTHVKY